MCRWHSISKLTNCLPGGHFPRCLQNYRPRMQQSNACASYKTVRTDIAFKWLDFRFYILPSTCHESTWISSIYRGKNPCCRAIKLLSTASTFTNKLQSSQASWCVIAASLHPNPASVRPVFTSGLFLCRLQVTNITILRFGLENMQIY